MQATKRIIAVVALGTLGLAACGGDDGGGSTSDWCDTAREVEERFNDLDDVDFSDADSIQEAFAGAQEVIADAADDAPDEIRDDVETVADGIGELVDRIAESEGNLDDLMTAFEDFDSSEFEQAGENITEFNEEECGIEPDDSSDGTSDDTEAPDDTEATKDTTAPDDTDASGDGEITIPSGDDITDIMAESLRQAFPNLSDDQLSCLVDGLMAQGGNPGDVSDPSAFLELFNSCGIDLAELSGG